MSQSQSYGVVGPFDSTAEDWSSYEEQFRLYFTANDIKDDKKQRAIFLTTWTCHLRTVQEFSGSEEAVGRHAKGTLGVSCGPLPSAAIAGSAKIPI